MMRKMLTVSMRARRYLWLLVMFGTFSPALNAKMTVTVDPLYFGEYFVFYNIWRGDFELNSEPSIGFDYSLSENISIGAEGSLIPVVVAGITENGSEFGPRAKFRVFSFNQNIALLASPHLGYSNVLYGELSIPHDFNSPDVRRARVKSMYVGTLIGVLLFNDQVSIYPAVGAKYYFAPKSDSGVRIRRSGFVPNVELLTFPPFSPREN